MELLTKRFSINELFCYFFIAIYSVFPEYFRVFSLPVYAWIALAFLIVIMGCGANQARTFYWIKLFLPIFVVSTLSYGYFKEFSSYLVYLVVSFVSVLIIFLCLTTKKRVTKALDVIVITCLFICIFSLVEKVTGFNVFSLIENVDLGIMGTRPTIRDNLVRVESSFGSPITLGIYLLFANTATYLRIVDPSCSKMRKRIYQFNYILTFIVAYFTDSRMAFLSLIILQVVFFLRLRWNKQIVVIFFVVLVLVVDIVNNGYIFSFVSKYFGLVSDIIVSNGGEVSDLTSAYRIQLVPTLMPYIMNSPIFGYGNSVMQNFTFKIWGHEYYSIDNSILSEWMWHGFLGVIKMLLPIIYGIVKSIKVKKKDTSFGYCFLSIFIVYLFNLFSVAQMSDKRMLFVFLAIIMAYEYNITHQSEMMSYENRLIRNTNA